MFILTENNSIGTQFVNELRDIEIQKDRMRFRRNLERIGEILAYELSKTLDYAPKQIQTPLAVANSCEIKDELVITTILRAGVPMYQGVLNVFDHANSAFIASYRMPTKAGEEVEINMEYVASDDLTGKVVVLVDPMLASGKSLVKAYEGLLKNGTPKHVHIVAAIAAQEGVDYVNNNIQTEHSLWLGAVDAELNDKSYIVPGLGDAGDLCFGPKL
ncbi:uracil phosphoribosyltransferase [Sediminitomix flava]|uniref:Uracil phosphoribosyltransferase n=1 Tax=Sediminitomix flava TaxID=379075 RepID=A0A315ZG61_SEDFL|nr:uracil phosphoribosyltransferase [Sediminitomix flava]PWJ43734.1 uracil phosphoribosyltransferase [Sediminitomix flava]